MIQPRTYEIRLIAAFGGGLRGKRHDCRSRRSGAFGDAPIGFFTLRALSAKPVCAALSSSSFTKFGVVVAAH
jgi:hypothetical protein